MAKTFEMRWHKALSLRRTASRRFSSTTYAFNTPAIQTTRREDLDGKWDKLGFAIRNMNGHVRYTWSDGSWDQGIFVPAPYQLMHINAGALHYGVSVFEGMKAFACQDGKIRLMNPELNAQRMRRGAEALLMPHVPNEMFVAGVKEAVRRNREFVPPYGHGASMYIRPLLFASGPMLGLAPLASEYTFFVTVMPAGGYFGAHQGEEIGVSALVSETHDRAAPKGTGGVKAAGNYAADLFPVHSAQGQGFNTTLYLDAKERRYLEEFSVANFIGITHDGRYVTPKSETILASTTNMMLMQIARDKGLVVEERAIDFEEEIGHFKEIGMCGTAAVVVKVQSITRGDKVYSFDTFDTIADLRSTLIGIQCGEVDDTFGFMEEVCDVIDESPNPLPQQQTCFAPGMVTAEARGLVRKLGSEALHGHERHLLEYVVDNAEPGNPESVLAAMDAFWDKMVPLEDSISQKWEVRGQNIEQKVREKVSEVIQGDQPMRCLELGTYCGYSALRIARNLPDNGSLLSVEKDALFASIATKIVEFAGLEHKVKIWVGTIDSEISNIRDRLQNYPADFVLCDHSLERYVPDLKLLEIRGVVGASTSVIGDLDIYPGDPSTQTDQRLVQDSIRQYFFSREFEEIQFDHVT